AAGNEGGAVVDVGRVRRRSVLGDHVTKYRRLVADRSLNSSRIRVEQQLRSVAAKASGRIPWPGYAETVVLPGPDAWDIAVPAKGRGLRQAQPRLATLVVEQAQVHALRHLGKNRKVDSVPVVGRAEGKGFTGPDVIPHVRIASADAVRNSHAQRP